MTTFNTGNRLGSNAPKDLYDNAENLDNGINGTAKTWTDRLGVVRKSWTGIETDFQQFLADGSTIEFPTWAAASAAAGAGLIPQNRQVAVVGDEGTHVDPVSGATVQNSGRYVMVPGGLEWRAADVLTQKADRVELTDAVDEIERVTSDRPTVEVLQHWTDSGGFVAAKFGSDSLETTEFSFGRDGYQTIGDEVRSNAALSGTLVRDAAGFWIERVGAGFTLGAGGEYRSSSQADYIIRDPFGFWAFSAMSPRAAADSTARDRLLASGNAEALALSVAVKDAIPADIQRPVFDYNIVLIYGQSLAAAYEGWPAKSKVNQEPNLLMLGQSTRPTNRASSSFVPVGTETLQPLRAVVQSTATGSPVMTDAEVAMLTGSANNDGESVEVGAINFWRQLYLQDRWLDSDPSRKVVALNCAVGGQSVARLSKGHSLGYYNRLASAVSKVKAIADAEGKTCGVVAVLYLQGEFDYTQESEGVNDRAVFRAATERLFEDITNDVAFGICAQPQKPAFFTYQTGAQYSRDNAELAIGRAQIDMAEKPGVFLATPNAPYTDKAGHLDANGYRWMGMQFGKVMHKVLTQGEGWQPVKPIKAVVIGQEALVHFIVPHPPLQFAASYRVSQAYDPVSKGFRVTDANGDVLITGASIAGAATVSLSLARSTVGAVKVWYAPSTVHQGHGSVRDSDPTVAPFSYEYAAGSGDFPQADIAELVGKPYPLNNYSVANVLDAIVI